MDLRGPFGKGDLTADHLRSRPPRRGSSSAAVMSEAGKCWQALSKAERRSAVPQTGWLLRNFSKVTTVWRYLVHQMVVELWQLNFNSSTANQITGLEFSSWVLLFKSG